MNFIDIAIEYENKFGEKPPILTTLDVENEEYLNILKKAIEDNKPVDRDYLGTIFMTDETAFY